jgi:hypothetical protein
VVLGMLSVILAVKCADILFLRGYSGKCRLFTYTSIHLFTSFNCRRQVAPSRPSLAIIIFCQFCCALRILIFSPEVVYLLVWDR